MARNVPLSFLYIKEAVKKTVDIIKDCKKRGRIHSQKKPKYRIKNKQNLLSV